MLHGLSVSLSSHHAIFTTCLYSVLSFSDTHWTEIPLRLTIFQFSVQRSWATVLGSYHILSGSRCSQNQGATMLPPLASCLSLPRGSAPFLKTAILQKHFFFIQAGLLGWPLICYLFFLKFLNIVCLCTIVITVCLKCTLKLLYHQFSFQSILLYVAAYYLYFVILRSVPSAKL